MRVIFMVVIPLALILAVPVAIKLHQWAKKDREAFADKIKKTD